VGPRRPARDHRQDGRGRDPDRRAYHYFAGGKPNAVCLEPTPRDWRSDCSQFVAAVYKQAGLPSPSTGPHEGAATSNIDPHGRVTTQPKPGDLGMYGTHRGSTHHVELYCGAPGQEFIPTGPRRSTRRPLGVPTTT
jgi:cell wall-associated NlpC family hydrolase